MTGQLQHYCLLCLLLFAATATLAEEEVRVLVADPFIELRTGPGGGYPVFYVVERGGDISIIKRKTSWFKVRAANGKEGWVDRQQMELTMAPDGSAVDFADPRFEDVTKSHWEAGLFSGEFDGAALISLYGGYAFSENLSFEITATQVLGDYSELELYNFSVNHYVFPQWLVTPYFSIGSGRIKTKPKSSLVTTANRDDDTLNVGVGIRAYLTQEFFFRLEYRNYVVLTNRDENEELEEWKAGFKVIF